MKIRTGFVTNSSSYSSAVIRIQSKELTDLLKKYQEPLFPKGEWGFDGKIQGVSFQGNLISVNREEVANGWSCPPESLDDFIESLLCGLAWQCEEECGEEVSESDDFKQMCAEVRSRKKELTDSIQKVKWEFHDNSYDEFEPEDSENRIRTFYYVSSYSSVSISIRSKELANLLKKYRKSLFPRGERGIYGLGEIQGVSIRGDLISVNEEAVADGWSCLPKSLDDFIEKLLDGLARQYSENAPDDFKQLCAEVQSQVQELTDSIQKVKWTFQGDSYGEFEETTDVCMRRFTYNRKKGGAGTYEECFEDEE